MNFLIVPRIKPLADANMCSLNCPKDCPCVTNCSKHQDCYTPTGNKYSPSRTNDRK